MPPPTTGNKHSVQNVMNWSFDPEFNINAVEPMMYDPTSGTVSRSYPASPLNLKPYDYFARVLTNSTTETYTYKSGGSGGTTTNTLVIVYTDSTLATISSITKT